MPPAARLITLIVRRFAIPALGKRSQVVVDAQSRSSLSGRNAVVLVRVPQPRSLLIRRLPPPPPTRQLAPPPRRQVTECGVCERVGGRGLEWVRPSPSVPPSFPSTYPPNPQPPTPNPEARRPTSQQPLARKTRFVGRADGLSASEGNSPMRATPSPFSRLGMAALQGRLCGSRDEPRGASAGSNWLRLFAAIPAIPALFARLERGFLCWRGRALQSSR
jgi:hypothetical protein